MPSTTEPQSREEQVARTRSETMSRTSGSYTSNADHVCVEYEPEHPCETEGCDEPTVFVSIAAPGTGSGRTCKAGHFHGTCRELTAAEVR